MRNSPKVVAVTEKQGVLAAVILKYFQYEIWPNYLVTILEHSIKNQSFVICYCDLINNNK